MWSAKFIIPNYYGVRRERPIKCDSFEYSPWILEVSWILMEATNIEAKVRRSTISITQAAMLQEKFTVPEEKSVKVRLLMYLFRSNIDDSDGKTIDIDASHYELPNIITCSYEAENWICYSNKFYLILYCCRNVERWFYGEGGSI